MPASPTLDKLKLTKTNKFRHIIFLPETYLSLSADVEVGKNGGVSGAATVGGGWLIGAAMARRVADEIQKMAPTRTTLPDLRTIAWAVISGAGGADGRRD